MATMTTITNDANTNDNDKNDENADDDNADDVNDNNQSVVLSECQSVSPHIS